MRATLIALVPARHIPTHLVALDDLDFIAPLERLGPAVDTVSVHKGALA